MVRGPLTSCHLNVVAAGFATEAFLFALPGRKSRPPFLENASALTPGAAGAYQAALPYQTFRPEDAKTRHSSSWVYSFRATSSPSRPPARPKLVASLSAKQEILSATSFVRTVLSTSPDVEHPASSRCLQTTGSGLLSTEGLICFYGPFLPGRRRALFGPCLWGITVEWRWPVRQPHPTGQNTCRLASIGRVKRCGGARKAVLLVGSYHPGWPPNLERVRAGQAHTPYLDSGTGFVAEVRQITGAPHQSIIKLPALYPGSARVVHPLEEEWFPDEYTLKTMRRSRDRRPKLHQARPSDFT